MSEPWPAAATDPGLTIDVPAGHPGALALALERAPAGAILRLPAARFRGPLVIRRSVAIVGLGPDRTELTGAGQIGVLAVVDPGAALHLVGVAVRGGAAYQGGGLALHAGHARLEDVVFTGCRAAHAGGAIYAGGEGLLAGHRLLIARSAAPQGGGVAIDGSVRARLEDAVIEENDADHGGGLFVREGSVLDLVSVFVRRNGARRGASALEARGSTTRAPVIEMAGGALAGGLAAVRLEAALTLADRRAGAGAAPARAPLVRPRLRARGAALPEEVRGLAGFEDAGENTACRADRASTPIVRR